LLQVVRQLPQANFPTLCLSAGVVAFVLLCYRFVPRFPGALLAVVGTVAASAAFHFSGHGIQVVGPGRRRTAASFGPDVELGACSRPAASRWILQ